MSSALTNLRQQLRRSGYSPIPCEGKAVHITGWQLKYDAKDEEIESWETFHSRANNSGIITRNVPTFDIDITDEAAARAVEELIRAQFEEHGRILVRTGKAPKRAIPFRTNTPFPKITRNFTAQNGTLHKIEFLCDGQQFVAFGIHPDTNQPYRWHGGDPLTVLRDELPNIGWEEAFQLVDNVVELLAREHGYTVAAVTKGNGKDGEHGHAEWSVLIGNLANGHEMHDSTVSLAAKLITGGMSDGAVVNFLRGAYMSSQVVKDERWQERYDDIGRCVRTARGKFGKDTRVEVLPESQYFGEKPAVEPPALIKGIFPQTGVATIGGQSGAGKTFQAVHIGVSLIPDCKQQVYIDRYKIKRHGGVLYLVLEGKPAFPLRVTAAFDSVLNRQLKFGDRAKLPFAWNTYQPSLFEKGPDVLIKLAAREAQRMRKDFNVDLVAIFLDTMGLAACYENEDRSAQVLRVVSGLNRLSDETGALVINVDHMGKDQEAGLRGTSAKRDAVETIITCLIDRDKGTNKAINHRMQLFKTRDGEEGRVIPYRLNVVDMDKDEDGLPITTCVVQWDANRPPPARRGAPKKKQTDVNLDLAIKEVGGLPADVERLRKAFYKHHGGTDHAANMAWNRAINNRLELDEDGKLGNAEM